LPVDVASFEPALALFAGADGLDVVRRLVDELVESRPSLLALELAPTQTRIVAELLRASGWDAVEVLSDLAGRERVVVGRS
jgi:release factor glutamine methyltransferase